MFKLFFITTFSLLLTITHATAATRDAQKIYDVMRGIGIKYLVSEDRKLPKKDREAWEKSLADYVDFNALNTGMKERVRKAAAKDNNAMIDEATLTSMEEKAVLFLVPRELSDYTIFYLKAMDKITDIPRCSDALQPRGDEKYSLCEQNIGPSEIAVNVIIPTEDNIALVFKKTDRWRLAHIEKTISDKMLLLIANWK